MTSEPPPPPPPAVPSPPDFERGRSWKEAIKKAAKEGVRKAAGIAEPAGQVAGWVSSRASPLSDYSEWAECGVALWYPSVPIAIAVTSKAISRVARASAVTEGVADIVKGVNECLKFATWEEEAKPSEEEEKPSEEEKKPSEEEYTWDWVFVPRKLTSTQCMAKMMDGRSLRVADLVRSMGFDGDKVQEILTGMRIDYGVTVDRLLRDGRRGEFYAILIRED